VNSPNFEDKRRGLSAIRIQIHPEFIVACFAVLQNQRKGGRMTTVQRVGEAESMTTTLIAGILFILRLLARQMAYGPVTVEKE
jgi:hypothetical protein